MMEIRGKSKDKKYRLVLAAIIGISGLVVLCLESKGLQALAIIAMLWAHNLEKH